MDRCGKCCGAVALAVVLLLALNACGRRPGLDVESTLVEVGPGRWVASVATGRQSKVYELSETISPLQLTKGDDVNPAVSPSGRFIGFGRMGSDGRRAVWLLDRESREEQQLTTPGPSENDDVPMFVDEDRIVFLRAGRNASTLGRSWVDWDLVLIERSTRVEKRLTQLKFWEAGRPVYCPSSGRIALAAAAVSEPLRIAFTTMEGVITWDRHVEGHGAILPPDCRDAVVVSKSGQRSNQMYTYDLYLSLGDGRARKRLTDMSTRLQSPSLSRDLQGVFFVSDDESGPLSAWRVGIDGGTPVELKLLLP